jgi:hypothetical protein
MMFMRRMAQAALRGCGQCSERDDGVNKNGNPQGLPF